MNLIEAMFGENANLLCGPCSDGLCEDMGCLFGKACVCDCPKEGTSD